MGTWLYNLLGLDGRGWPYNFMSGLGSFLPTLGMFGLAGGWFRKHNCQQHGCWRMGRHPVDKDVFTCRRHHPDGGYEAPPVS